MIPALSTCFDIKLKNKVSQMKLMFLYKSESYCLAKKTSASYFLSDDYLALNSLLLFKFYVFIKRKTHSRNAINVGNLANENQSRPECTCIDKQ